MRDYGAPLRVTWALPSDPALALALWSRLREGRVLFVEATAGPEDAASAAAVLREAALPGSPKLSLAASAQTAMEIATACEDLAPLRAELFVEALGADARSLETLRSRWAKVALSLWSDEDGVRQFASAVALALGAGVDTLAILNPSAPAHPLRSETVSAAVEAWDLAGRPKALSLRVHDLFLAEALGLDPFKGYPGCAAASTLAHLRADEEWVACRTLPVPLGNLRDGPLTELWKRPQRIALRDRLGETPEACGGCALSASCRGGCPGLWNAAGRDGSCHGPRRREG
jgi:radical SAM protein with 4Fe4S-binding SPASM domain